MVDGVLQVVDETILLQIGQLSRPTGLEGIIWVYA